MSKYHCSLEKEKKIASKHINKQTKEKKHVMELKSALKLTKSIRNCTGKQEEEKHERRKKKRKKMKIVKFRKWFVKFHC